MLKYQNYQTLNSGKLKALLSLILTKYIKILFLKNTFEILSKHVFAFVNGDLPEKCKCDWIFALFRIK